MTFGEKLKSARIAKGLTQKELGNVIGAKNSAISNWEKDLNKPDVELLSAICGALEVSASYFIEAKEKGLALSEYEEMHIKKYRSLDQFGKKAVNGLLETEYERCTTQKPNIVPMSIASRSFNDEYKTEIIEDDINDYINAPENDIDM